MASEDFKRAFRAARAAGKETFKWNGSSYNTKLASDTPTPPKRPAELNDKKPAETKWADPGLKEGGKPRDDEPSKPTMDTKGWRDPGDIENKNRAAGYAFRKGGMVKKAGAATIGVTRSSRDYGKKAYAKGGAVKGKC